MAATASGAPVVHPDTYYSKYSTSADVLDGDYAQLFAHHAVNQATAPADLLERMSVASELVPKVFLVEVTLPGGNLAIMTVFRVTKFVPHPIRASPWDGRIFAFMGDVEVNNFINIVEFFGDAFEITDESTVHPLGQVDFAIQAQLGQSTLDALPDGAQNAEWVRSRFLVQVPHAYIPLVFSRVLTPIEAWDTLGAAIISDGNEVACDLLLNWLRQAMQHRPNAADPTVPEMPATYIGDLTTVFPVLAVDSALNAFRWEILKSDLPVLNKGAYATSEPLLHVLKEMRDERKQEQEREELKQAWASAEKLPSAVFPTTVKKWLRLAAVDRESDLPELYGLWANCSKHERRRVFSDKVAERSTQDGAATRFEPIVSKELFEKVMQGNVAPAPHQIEDLSLGLQPFALGNFAGDSLGDTIQARADAYDLMLVGNMAPTLSEQDTFSTKEIRLPTDVYTTGLMLKTTSVVYDVATGTGNPHALRYRHFCRNEWPEMEATLHLSGTENPDLLPTILPRIVRWIQIRHSRYLKGLMDQPHPPPLPQYRDLVDAVLDRNWVMLPAIPNRYKLAPRRQRQESGAAEQTKDGAPVPPTDKAKEKDKEKPALVQNPNTNPVWIAALQESGKKLPEIQEHAPMPKHKLRDGKLVPVCLSWHLKGTCYQNCKRAVSHRALTAVEQTEMAAMVAAHVAHH